MRCSLAGGARGTARHLSGATLKAREAMVRRFQSVTDLWPWQWRPVRCRRADGGSELAAAAVVGVDAAQLSGRAARISIYLVDERYPWAAICERELGSRPVQILDDSNAIGHVVEYEGDPRRRPLTRDELTLLFDHLGTPR